MVIGKWKLCPTMWTDKGFDAQTKELCELQHQHAEDG